MLLKHEEVFIKVCTLRDEHLLGQRIVELPALVALGISNEDTLLHVRSKAPTWLLVLLDQNIGSTAPNTQMRQIRLVPIECFMWGDSLKRSGGHLIAHMNEGGNRTVLMIVNDVLLTCRGGNKTKGLFPSSCRIYQPD